MADEASKHCPIENPIRLRRKKMGLTIAELARLIDVTPSIITRYENGYKPSYERLETLAGALGVSINQLRIEFMDYWQYFYESAVEKAGLGEKS